MMSALLPLYFLMVVFAGWLKRQQQAEIEGSINGVRAGSGRSPFARSPTPVRVVCKTWVTPTIMGTDDRVPWPVLESASMLPIYAHGERTDPVGSNGVESTSRGQR
jgi:hypothetical protein